MNLEAKIARQRRIKQLSARWRAVRLHYYEFADRGRGEQADRIAGKLNAMIRKLESK